MGRIRLVCSLALLAICLFVATNPVFAAAGGNGNGNNGNGKGNGGPGNPVLPEAPVAIMLLGAGLVVVVIACLVVTLRRNGRTPVAE
ncbi:MAG: hypothetical protein M3176_08755 [Chloroflexota bacterium]|nr:hypothetical protein [Chloroflexota bacterium]MDQ6906905.1 hypothetical protein [Chloroflexota bacterium]